MSNSEHSVFDSTKYIPPTKFLIDKIIPNKSLTFVLSQSGVGKSWFVEYIASCMIKGKNFLDKHKTLNGDVLLIDQDTPTEVLNKRLNRFLGDKKYVNKLYIESMQGYNMDYIRELYQSYPEVKLIIIDSLHSVIGNINVNSTNDMRRLMDFKQAIIGIPFRDISIIITHHISEKKLYTIDDYMFMDNWADFSMGNSIINQCADNIFILTSPDKGKQTLTKLYVRPIAKRFDIPTQPFKLKLEENEELEFKFNGYYEKKDEFEELILDALKKSDKYFNTVNDLYNIIGLYGMVLLRAKLRLMISEKKLIFSKARHNRYLFASKERDKPKELKK